MLLLRPAAFFDSLTVWPLRGGQTVCLYAVRRPLWEAGYLAFVEYKLRASIIMEVHVEFSDRYQRPFLR